MGEKRKFFQFQNISKGSQPSTENLHPCQKARERLLAKAYGCDGPISLAMAASSLGCCHRGRRWEPAGRGTSPHHPCRDLGPFAREGLCVRQTVGLPPRSSGKGLPLLSCTAHTQSSPPVPSSPPQSENAHTYLADKTLLSQETSNMLGPHFHAGEECDLIFSLRPIIWSLPFTPPGHKEDLSLSAKGWVAVCGTPQQDPPLLRPWCPWHSAGLLSPWVLRLLGPRSGLPHDRSPRESRGSAEGAEPPGDSAALAWYQSSAWRSRINQCFGLVFGYYGQYIKGIYLRKCLSCQSFPISSILNTPYNYWYYPGKFSPWSFLH